MFNTLKSPIIVKQGLGGGEVTMPTKTTSRPRNKKTQMPPELLQPVVDANRCMHHWVIEMPSGPFSTGVCRVCGSEKKFQNYLENSSWGTDVSLEQLAAKAGVASNKMPAKPKPDDEG